MARERAREMREERIETKRRTRRGLHIMYSKRRDQERAITGKPQPNQHVYLQFSCRSDKHRSFVCHLYASRYLSNDKDLEDKQ